MNILHQMHDLLNVCYQPLSEVVDIFHQAKSENGDAGRRLGQGNRAEATDQEEEHEWRPQQHELSFFRRECKACKLALFHLTSRSRSGNTLFHE